jgi:hypothetical protein
VNRRSHLTARCLGAALATTLAVASVLVAVPASAQVPRAPHHYSAAIEGLAGYQPQRTCSPSAKPGTVAFANLLLRTYKNSRSLGIVRACNVGGTSEHKEGRAFDWGVSAFSAQDRRSVNAVMHWLLKKDKYGNRYAMARRLGIQYMIWNHRIWGSYSASSGWRRYTGSNPHTDHVHFSLSWKGARRLTSFWRPKRFGQPAPTPPKPKPEPAPQPKPTPKPTPPEPTPKPGPGPNHGPSRPGSHTKSLPEPSSPRSLRTGPALVNENLSIPARRREGVTTRAALQRGHTYLVEVSGTFRYGKRAKAVADAECSTARRSGWERNRSLRGEDWLDHLDVYIDGHDLYAEGDNGQECDTDTHTYRWYYQAQRTGRTPLRIWDPIGHGDNHGRLGVHIVDVAQVPDKMAWRVPADAPAGATSPGSLEAGVRYQVTVTGVWSAGGGYRADAECSVAGDDNVWRRDRSADPYNPGADHFDVLQDKQDLGLEPLTDTGDRCDADDHAYRYLFTPSGETRPVNFRVEDPAGYGNNRGELRVRVAPYVEPAPQPIVTEQVSVDSRSATPVQTRQSYPRGAQLLVSVKGTYRWSSGLDADAECSQVLYRDRYYWDNFRAGRGDLSVNGVIGTWYPDDGSGECDDTHRYTRQVRVDSAGPLTFAVSDDSYSDNSGALTVTVEEVR